MISNSSSSSLISCLPEDPGDDCQEIFPVLHCSGQYHPGEQTLPSWSHVCRGSSDSPGEWGRQLLPWLASDEL